MFTSPCWSCGDCSGGEAAVLALVPGPYIFKRTDISWIPHGLQKKWEFFGGVTNKDVSVFLQLAYKVGWPRSVCIPHLVRAHTLNTIKIGFLTYESPILWVELYMIVLRNRNTAIMPMNLIIQWLWLRCDRRCFIENLSSFGGGCTRTPNGTHGNSELRKIEIYFWPPPILHIPRNPKTGP